VGGPAAFSFTVTDDGTTDGVSDPQVLAQSLDITVTEVNDAPELTAGTVSDLTVAEDSGTTSLGLGGLAYGVGGGGDESGQTLSYAVTAVPASSLGDVVLADGTTVVAPGAYTLAEIQGMQFRAAADAVGGPATFSFTVTDDGTTDGVADPLVLAQSLDITVTEVNDAPTAVDDAAPVNEGGSVVVDLSGNDTDPDNALDLSSIVITSAPTHGSLVDNGDGTFTYTHDGSETVGDSFSYTIDDVSGATSDVASVTLTVTPQNDAPTASDAVFNLDENSAEGTVVGTVSATDPDAGDSLSYAITDGDPVGAFSIDATTGEITVADASQLDFETTPVFNLAVEVTDSGGFTDTAATTVNLSDVNEAPTAGGAAFSLEENSANGTVVGTVFASDPDSGDTFSYAITAGNTGSAFAIDAATGEITVADSSQLDFGTTPVFNLTVEVTDAGGLSDAEVVPISLEPVDQPVIDGSEIPPPDEEVDPPDDSDDTGTEPTEDTEADENAPVKSGELRSPTAEQVRWPRDELIPMNHESSSSEGLAQETRRDSSRHGEYEAGDGRFAVLRTQQMMQMLDQIREEMANDAELAAGQREMVVSSAEGVALAVSAGLLALLLRGSSLAAVALSALPVWRRVDPLAVLALSDEERKKREEELRAAQEKEDVGEEAVGRLLDRDEPRVG
jgi:hypothetical protein